MSLNGHAPNFTHRNWQIPKSALSVQTIVQLPSVLEEHFLEFAGWDTWSFGWKFEHVCANHHAF